MKGWDLGTRLYCDRECSDKIKFCFSFTQIGQMCNLVAFRTMCSD